MRMMLIAVDVTGVASPTWGAASPQHVALSAGLVGLLQRDEQYLRPEVVAGALREIHPDRWQRTALPGVFAVKTDSGRALLAWAAEGGTVIGFVAELAMAINQECAIQVLVPAGGPSLVVQ